MCHLSPDAFWQVFREQLRGSGKVGETPANRWEALQSDRSWTEVAMKAAEGACDKFGLETSREYFRVDLGGFTRGPYHAKPDFPEFQWYDWDMKVAFEHENSLKWRDELCKLTHLVADLCVLVSYYQPGQEEKIADELRKAFDVMGDRMTRVSGRAWLFVFGPNLPACRADERASFKAFTLGRDGQPIPLLDTAPLCPAEWQVRTEG